MQPPEIKTKKEGKETNTKAHQQCYSVCTVKHSCLMKGSWELESGNVLLMSVWPSALQLGKHLTFFLFKRRIAVTLATMECYNTIRLLSGIVITVII